MYYTSPSFTALSSFIFSKVDPITIDIFSLQTTFFFCNLKPSFTFFVPSPTILLLGPASSYPLHDLIYPLRDSSYPLR